MTKLLQKIPAGWRKGVYIFTAILTAGLFTFGVVSPDVFQETVSNWVKIFTDVTALFAAILALSNVTVADEN